MEKSILILALALNALFTHSQEGPKGLPINATAPLFTAKGQNGKEVSLKEDLKNGPVVLMFYRGQCVLIAISR